MIVSENLEAAPEALTITCPSRLMLHLPPATLHSARCTGATVYALDLMNQLSGFKHKTRTILFIANRPDWKMSFVMTENVARIIDNRQS